MAYARQSLEAYIDSLAHLRLKMCPGLSILAVGKDSQGIDLAGGSSF